VWDALCFSEEEIPRGLRIPHGGEGPEEAILTQRAPGRDDGPREGGGGVAAWLVSRLMSPDFVSPFPPIITIPIIPI
jgi:hypothetical protein